MGDMSIVSGYIVTWDERHMEHNRRAIANFPFDTTFPFTNIFWPDSPARFFFPVIGFTGAYRAIEDVWSEWLWKFSQLLTRLEAIRAQVSLDCVIGSYSWELRPKANCVPYQQVATFVGEQWVITKAPAQDFSIDAEWLRLSEQNQQYDSTTNSWHPYRWAQFVDRMPQEY